MNKNKYRMISLICLLSLVMSALCGCGSSKGSGEYKIINPNKSEQEMEEQKNDNTLTVWCWDPAFNINAMEEAAKIYKKTHPDFELVVVETPSDDVQTKLETAVLSATTENLPDIILIQDRAFQKNVINYPDGFVDLTDTGIDFRKY